MVEMIIVGVLLYMLVKLVGWILGFGDGDRASQPCRTNHMPPYEPTGMGGHGASRMPQWDDLLARTSTVDGSVHLTRGMKDGYDANKRAEQSAARQRDIMERQRRQNDMLEQQRRQQERMSRLNSNFRH